MLIQEFYEKIEGDYENIKGRLQSDELIQRFVLKFLKEKSFEEMMETAANNDVQNTILTSHKLKGVVANLSFDRLFTLVSELLADLRKENQDSVNMDLIQKIKEEYEFTIKLIQELQ